MWSRLDGLAWSFWDFKGHTLLCCRATHKERVGHAFLSSMELDGTDGTIGCVRTESLVLGCSEAMHLFTRGHLLAKRTRCADYCESNISERKLKTKVSLRGLPSDHRSVWK
jgi:hypothetical protein